MELHWHLSETDFFSGLSVEKQAFLECAVRRNARANDFIFLQGDPAESAFYLEKGEVRICRISCTGKESIIFPRMAGELFGLAEVVGEGGRQRECNAQAHTHCRYYEIRKDDFDQLLARYPILAQRVMGVLGRRLRYLCEQVENLMVLDVNTRLLKLLVYLSYQQLIDPQMRNQPITIPTRFTQSQIAAMIGSCQQTVSEALKRLEAEGLIRFSHRGIIVLKPYDVLMQIV